MRLLPVAVLAVALAAAAAGCGSSSRGAADTTHQAAVHPRATNAPSTPLVLEGATQGALPTLAKPPAAVVKQWPAAWCKVKRGMTLARAEKLMGVPQLVDGKAKATLADATGAKSAVWRAQRYSFTAKLGGGRRIVSLTAAQAPGLSCAGSR